MDAKVIKIANIKEKKRKKCRNLTAGCFIESKLSVNFYKPQISQITQMSITSASEKNPFNLCNLCSKEEEFIWFI